MSNNWINIQKDPCLINKARAKAAALRKTVWWKQQIAKGICYYCGNTCSPSKLTMDHILPIVRGGKSGKSNCVPCCKICNNEKKYLTPAELIMQELEN